VKKFHVPLALLCALALPAGALAATKGYVGNTSPSGTVTFKVKKKNGERKVKAFRFRDIPVTCADGAHTTLGNITSAQRINKQNKFNISASNSTTGAEVKIHGKVSGISASGTLKVTGNVPIDGDPSASGSNCDSGVLTWTASH